MPLKLVYSKGKHSAVTGSASAFIGAESLLFWPLLSCDFAIFRINLVNTPCTESRWSMWTLFVHVAPLYCCVDGYSS